MSHTERGMQVAGGWLALAALLIAGTFIIHGPVDPDPAQQITHVAEGANRWLLAHWAAAVSLSFFAMAGVLVLAARSRLTEDWWTMSAWAVLPIGALWTVSTAVVEATVVTEAAIAGDAATFQTWLAFAEGKANGFAALALAVATIAGTEAARPRQALTPSWASWIAVIGGLGAVVGWALGMWLEIAVGSIVWVVSSLVMSLWTVWFGLALALGAPRVRAAAGARSAA